MHFKSPEAGQWGKEKVHVRGGIPAGAGRKEVMRNAQSEPQLAWAMSNETNTTKWTNELMIL